MKLGSSLKAAAEKSKKKDAYSGKEEDPNKYTQLKYSKKGNLKKRKEISKKAYERKKKRYSKKGESYGTETSIGAQTVAKNKRKSVTRTDVKRKKELMEKIRRKSPSASRRALQDVEEKRNINRRYYPK